MQQPITSADLETYRREGFLHLRGLLDADLLSALRAGITSGMLNAASILESTGEDDSIQADFGCNPSWTDTAVALRQVFDTHPGWFWRASKAAQETPDIVAFGNEPSLIEIAKRLGLKQPGYAIDPYIVWAANWMNDAGAYSIRPLHQDWERMQGSLDGLVLWIPLVETCEDSFGLRVFPGSHLNGPVTQTQNNSLMRIVDQTPFQSEKEHLVTTKLGDVVVFSAFLVHGTGRGRNDALRPALTVRYNNHLEPSFIKRGFPSAFTRSACQGLLEPDFPTPGQLAKVFRHQ